MTKIKVFIGGDLSYEKNIIAFLESSYVIELTDHFEKADLIYWVYGSGPALLKNIKFWLFSNKKIILHWIGTDVQWFVNKIRSRNLKSLIYYRLWNYFIKRRVRKGYMINLCCASWLIKELNTIGLNPQYVPLTTLKSNSEYTYKNARREFDFMSYIPQDNFDFYGGNLIFSLATELKEYSFQIIIPDILSVEEFNAFIPVPKNITLISHIAPINMQFYYTRSKCFLRFTKHDGLSLSVIEALYNQLQVLWTYSFPTVTHIKLDDSFVLKEEMIKKVKDWQPNLEGQKFVINELNLTGAIEKFKSAIRKDN